MNDIQAISGTRRAMKEMSDGTLRVQIDIDPRFRAQFFEMFGQIDMPVALAPLVADFEKREPEPEDHGKHYKVLFKAGWFNNPKVISAFGVDRNLAPAARTDAIKSLIYERFEVASLAEIVPDAFVLFCHEAGIRATLPTAFGSAA